MRTLITIAAVVAALASRGPEPQLGAYDSTGDDGQAARTGTPSPPPASRTWDERRIDLPIVGPSMAYVPRAATNHVVLFLSGDGGWNLGVVDMARRIAPKAVVVGISFPQLARAAVRNAGCWYPAGDLEVLSHAAQKRLNLTEYRAPALIGYSSGATLVYAALAPAPPTAFAGAISLGFCADVDVARPICHSGGWVPAYDEHKHLTWLPAVKRLTKAWYLLHGVQDQVCSPEQTRAFVKGIENAHLVELEGTGHGFGKPVHWQQPFDDAVDAIWKANETPAREKAAPESFSAIEARLDKLDLPLEYRWPSQAASTYLIFFSGDGGWASLDDSVATRLTEHGIAVVGVNSLRYFWRAKSPAQIGHDLQGLITAIGHPVFVGGYSFGAEVLPVVVRGWSEAERASIDGFVLVAPSRSASFEINPLDWVRTPAEDPATRVVPAVQATRLPTLCVMGADDNESACAGLGKSPPFQVVSLPGSHHFDGNYTAIADTIAKFMQTVAGRDREPDVRRTEGLPRSMNPLLDK